MNNIKSILEKEFIEKGADLEHERWARWQSYLHSKCSSDPDGSLIIPASLVARWERQINTPYSDLSEEEKESDRKEVRKYLPIVEKLVERAKQEGRDEEEFDKRYAIHDAESKLQ